MKMRTIVEGAAALVILAALGVFHWSMHRAAAMPPTAGWAKVAWPFPIDQWGRGTAFRCKAADCGAEIMVYLRPKIGFCNCATGVSDDAELERVADVSLLDDRYTALAPGRAIKIGRMAGRSRPYVVDRAARDKVLAIAFNERCDVIAATAVIVHAEPAAFEPQVLAFLNGDTVMRWAELKLGL
jgi:hypothetical protein